LGEKGKTKTGDDESDDLADAGIEVAKTAQSRQPSDVCGEWITSCMVIGVQESDCVIVSGFVCCLSFTCANAWQFRS
jgi:hypothetical protein